MATYENILVQNHYESNLVTRHYHTEYISNINDDAKNNIPPGAVIDSKEGVQLYLNANWDSSVGDPDVYFYFCPDDSSKYDSGDKLYSGKLDSEPDTHIKDITSYVTRTYPFSINTSYPKLSLIFKSTLAKKYHCDLFKIIYKFSIPSYTVSVTTNMGGSVIGGGSYDNQSIATLTATANTGYTFVRWNDGNTDNPRTITVTDNITLIAYFEPITYYVSYNNNGGSGSMNNQDFVYDTVENLTSIGNSMIGPVVKLTYNYNDYITSNSEDESNKVFSYWYDNEDKNNSNKWYLDGQEVINLRSTNGATVPLYAQWGDAFFTLEAPSRKYHQFLNWTDGTNIYNAGDTASFSTNTTLTAQWKKNQYRAFSGIDNIEKMYLSKNKKIEKIFVGTTEV